MRALTAGCLLLLTACAPRNFANDNDRLRRENLDLQRRVEDLNAALQQRVDEITVLEQKLADRGVTDIDAPRLTTLRLGRYAGPVDTDADGSVDQLRLYLVTLDQDGRFIPVRAEAVVRVVELPVEGEPRMVERATFSPVELAAAYRSGMTGTHYRLELPLPDDAPPQFTVRVTLVQADGVQVSAEGVFNR